MCFWCSSRVNIPEVSTVGCINRVSRHSHASSRVSTPYWHDAAVSAPLDAPSIHVSPLWSIQSRLLRTPRRSLQISKLYNCRTFIAGCRRCPPFLRYVTRQAAFQYYQIVGNNGTLTKAQTQAAVGNWSAANNITVSSTVFLKFNIIVSDLLNPLNYLLLLPESGISPDCLYLSCSVVYWNDLI